MSEIGKVVERKQNTVILHFEKKEACDNCNVCDATRKDNIMVMEANNLCDANVGDTVKIELKNDIFLKAVLIMYGVPLIFMLSGFFGGYWISMKLNLGDLAGLVSFLLGMFLLFISYFIIKLSEKKIVLEKYVPDAIELVNE